MQGKRGRGERRIEEALAALVSAMSTSGVPWMVIGGIAIIARGVRRMTTDIDAAVQGDQIDLVALIRILARADIRPRIAGAEAFARENLVLLLRHNATGIDLDVSLAWTMFEREALAACTVARYGSVTAPMARAEDLVIFKAMASRPKDIDDAAALLHMHDDIDLRRVRQRLAELAAAADEPALVEGLEQAIRQATPVARHRASGGRITTRSSTGSSTTKRPRR